MVKFGYKLMTEEHGPRKLVDSAVCAEAAGFDFVSISSFPIPGSKHRATRLLPGACSARSPMRRTGLGSQLGSPVRYCAITLRSSRRRRQRSR